MLHEKVILLCMCVFAVGGEGGREEGEWRTEPRPTLNPLPHGARAILSLCHILVPSGKRLLLHLRTAQDKGLACEAEDLGARRKGIFLASKICSADKQHHLSI